MCGTIVHVTNCISHFCKYLGGGAGYEEYHKENRVSFTCLKSVWCSQFCIACIEGFGFSSLIEPSKSWIIIDLINISMFKTLNLKTFWLWLYSVINVLLTYEKTYGYLNIRIKI